MQNQTFSQQNCVVCESRDSSVQTRECKKTYIPLYAYGVLVIAPLIGLILMIAFRVEHTLTLPFCAGCWKGKKFASVLQGLCGVLLFASLPAGFALMLQLESGWAFFPLPVIVLLMIFAFEILKRKYQPKYKVVDRNRVVVATREGDLEFAKTTKATLHPA